VDYGPDCEEQEADCNVPDAMGYVRSGRAVYVDEDQALPGPSDLQTQEPEGQHRDPIVGQQPTGLDTKSAAALARVQRPRKGKYIRSAALQQSPCHRANGSSPRRRHQRRLFEILNSSNPP